MVRGDALVCAVALVALAGCPNEGGKRASESAEGEKAESGDDVVVVEPGAESPDALLDKLKEAHALEPGSVDRHKFYFRLDGRARRVDALRSRTSSCALRVRVDEKLVPERDKELRALLLEHGIDMEQEAFTYRLFSSHNKIMTDAFAEADDPYGLHDKLAEFAHKYRRESKGPDPLAGVTETLDEVKALEVKGDKASAIGVYTLTVKGKAKTHELPIKMVREDGRWYLE